MDNRRRLGIQGEELALKHLESQGLRLLARNYRCRLGELDLVFKDKNQIVFVEVRTKSSDKFGSGLDSITIRKRAKLKNLAQYFILSHNLGNIDVRFDVISILKPPVGEVVLEHIKGAF